MDTNNAGNDGAKFTLMELSRAVSKHPVYLLRWVKEKGLGACGRKIGRQKRWEFDVTAAVDWLEKQRWWMRTDTYQKCKEFFDDLRNNTRGP